MLIRFAIDGGRCKADFQDAVFYPGETVFMRPGLDLALKHQRFALPFEIHGPTTGLDSYNHCGNGRTNRYAESFPDDALEYLNGEEDENW